MQNTQTIPHKIVIVRSRRKTIAMTVRSDLTVEVRTPLYVSKAQIDEFLSEHSDWIDQNIAKLIRHRNEAEAAGILTKEDLDALAQKAAELVPQRTAHFAKLIGVSYGRITIRCQKTKWGSCSGKGNLNFNCLMMLMPPDVIDYLIVHELCHRKEMNHSPRFWAEVEKILPDYKIRVKWLREHEGEIMMRITRS